MGEGYARRTARVLLLDRTGRVLLLAYHADRHRVAWFTPGGGAANGESLPEAAARELSEEIGLALAPAELGPRVAFTTGYADLGWIRGQLRDDFFWHRVDGHVVDPGGLEPHERRSLHAHRWWSAGELAGTSETVYPLALAPLVADLAAGRVPATPVELPWHH